MALLDQYKQIKSKHPDALCLFRNGDTYECYEDDALVVIRILPLGLVRGFDKDNKPFHLCGFPHHALDTYLPKLVRAGKRIAICEQLEDPSKTKTLVKRGCGISELITPQNQ